MAAGSFWWHTPLACCTGGLTRVPCLIQRVFQHGQRRVARAGRTENDGGCNECIHCSACMAPFGVRVLQAGSALHCSPSPSPSPSPPQGRCILNGDLNWYDLTSLLVLFLVGGGGIDDAESLDG